MKRTPLLSELYFHYINYHPEFFLEENEATKLIESELEEFFEKAAEDKKNSIYLSNQLYSLLSEHLVMGFINGFRMCRLLLRELDFVEEKEFLSELLTDNIPAGYEMFMEPDFKERLRKVKSGEQDDD